MIAVLRNKRMTYFIGDIHSQYHKVSAVVADLFDYQEGAEHLVFLGDINDSELGGSNFVETYNLVKWLVDEGKATLIQSNHQHNLHRVLTGKRTKVSAGMLCTLKELRREGFIDFIWQASGDLYPKTEVRMEWLSTTATEMAAWLESRPFTYEEPNGGPLDGQDLMAVHAYYSQSGAQSRNRKWRDKCLYGLTKWNEQLHTNERIEWWADREVSEERPFVVAGHYHMLHLSDACAVVDGGCGHEDGRLYVYDSANHKFLAPY